MKTKEEIKQWLLDNCVDKYGNLDLSNLDFSDFNGDVNISSMRVKKNLGQDYQLVSGNLYQGHQRVNRNLYQEYQSVRNLLYQGSQEENVAYIKTTGEL